jgi:hypothetical protein
MSMSLSAASSRSSFGILSVSRVRTSEMKMQSRPRNSSAFASVKKSCKAPRENRPASPLSREQASPAHLPYLDRGTLPGFEVVRVNQNPACPPERRLWWAGPGRFQAEGGGLTI